MYTFFFVELFETRSLAIYKYTVILAILNSFISKSVVYETKQIGAPVERSRIGPTNQSISDHFVRRRVPITYCWTGPLILDHLYLVGK